MKIDENYSLKSLNTFGLDVYAAHFVEVSGSEEIFEIIENKELIKSGLLVLGGGSNVLFSTDFKGTLLKISIPGIKIIDEDKNSVFIEAGAGVAWDELVKYTTDRKLGGIENLSLIPGSAGAAPIQNIGAYGVEFKDVFLSLKGIRLSSGKEEKLLKDDCRFGYRKSIFKEELKGDFIITYITIKLEKNHVLKLGYGDVKNEIDKLNLDNVSVKDVRNVICGIRKNKLPDPARLGNAGSFFKNPEISELQFEKMKIEYNDAVGFPLGNNMVKIPAGWLIEKCGLKGKRIGNVGTHQKQALVIVNYGGATGSEVISFKNMIKKQVYNKFGIRLEEEVNII